jgi:hypothetical protein
MPKVLRENSSLICPQVRQGFYFKKFFRRHLNPLGISPQTAFEISLAVGIILLLFIQLVCDIYSCHFPLNFTILLTFSEYITRIVILLHKYLEHLEKIEFIIIYFQFPNFKIP